MNGRLMFDFIINVRALCATVRIYQNAMKDDVRTVNLEGTEPQAVELDFANGARINGSLNLKRAQSPTRPKGIEVNGYLNFHDHAAQPKWSFDGILLVAPDRSPSASTPSVPPAQPISAAAPDTPDTPAAPHAPDSRDAADACTDADARPGAASARPPRQVPGLVELFPYIYLRQHQEPDADARRRGFADMPDKFAELPFLAELAGATSAVQIKSIALQFISGKDSFDGQFVADPDQLQGPIALFRTVPALVNANGHAPNGLIEILSTHFGRTPAQMQASLAAPDHVANMARIWQSYFALLLSDDFDDALLAGLGKLLLTAHLLDYLFNPLPGSGGVDQPMLRDLLDASIVLPGAIFPSPPVKDGATNGSAAPAGVGELQMTRHRFLRHELGEVAHIENVMPRERKEIARRRLQGHVDTELGHSSENEARLAQSHATRHDLREQTLKATAEQAVRNQYDDFKTSYGPPTEATLKGVWTEWTLQGKKPGSDDVSRFARDVLARSVSNIARDVTHSRSRSVFGQLEESVTSVIDNSQGQDLLMCATRWVNTVYEASVDSYGRRLMVEFILPSPASAWIRQRRGRGPAALPVAPAQLGVSSFAAVDAGNYAGLAATYAVTDLSPPPAARRLSLTIIPGDEKVIPVPPGYEVSDAVVNWIGDAGQPQPVILIGCEKFQPGQPAQARSFGQQTEIAIAALAGTAPAPNPVPVPVPAPAPAPAVQDPPAPVPAPPPGPWPAPVSMINVDILCTPSATALDEWRIRTYAALLAGYQRQVEQSFREHASTAGAVHPQASRQGSRRIEKRELRRGCIQLLLQDGLARGATAQDSPQLPAPFTLQFLSDALEWNEMNVRYHGDAGNAEDLPLRELDEGGERSMDSFLDAELARVMVPADPRTVLPLLYLLGSGRCWRLASALAPVHAEHVGLAHALKQPEPPGAAPASPCWEVVVPTAMQALDTGFRIAAPASGENT
jgi:hypothetical protein